MPSQLVSVVDCEGTEQVDNGMARVAGARLCVFELSCVRSCVYFAKCFSSLIFHCSCTRSFDFFFASASDSLNGG
jgi:hypothetical protein